MNIKGKIVTLRAIEKKDIELLYGMINDPYMESCVVGWSFPVSLEQQENWISNVSNNQNNLRLIIETPEDGAVGLATLTNIDWKNRSATHGIKLANKKNRSKGIGTDTVMAVMRYAFEELQLNRLDGSWFPSNKPSKNLYTKLGWKVEGCKKRCVFKEGQYRDLEIAGILSEEYFEVAKKLNYWNMEK